MEPISEQTQKRSRTVITVLVVGAVLVFILFFGSVSAEVGDTALNVKCGTESDTIAYSDISSIELRDRFALGTRTLGMATAKIDSGDYNNTEFGDYRVAAYKGCSLLIVIRHSGGTFVFNLEDAEKTEAIYALLREKTGV